MKERRYDIDWLRVLATLAVFLFHCTRLFDTERWHVKNSEQIYLFHQTVIMVVGFFVIRRNLGIMAKLLIATAASFALVVILHGLPVRRFNGIRFPFGIKPRTKARVAIGATSDAAPC